VLPAIERYDGPVYRVLRRYLRENPENPPVVYILSAKFGLIDAARKIPNYDRRLTASLVKKMRQRVSEMAGNILRSRRWRSVGVCAGKDYRQALDGLQGILGKGARLDVILGGQGLRLARLKKWLRELA
jgi:hypothetical protein